MFARRLPRHRSRPRWTVRTVVPAAAAGNARETFTLALAALGLVNAIASFRIPWSSLSATLLPALLALACFIAAQRSRHKRFSWLLSASVATGLAIADLYNLMNTAPVGYAAVLLTGFAALLLAVRGRTRYRQRRSWPTREAASGVAHGLPEQPTARAAVALREAPDVTAARRETQLSTSSASEPE